MLFKSQVYTQASGSIGGVTYGRNSGGMYTRARGLVTNPNTPAQQAVRTAFGQASASWAALTDAQRTAWQAYASGTPTTNALGDALILTGQQMFNRVNALGSQPFGVTFGDAPTVLGLSRNGPTGLVIHSTGFPSIDMVVSATDEWSINDDGRLYVYLSPATKPTINFFKGPFQLATVFSGVTMTPPTNISGQLQVQYGPGAPINMVVNTGDVFFVRFLAVDATGRPSQESIVKLIAQA